MGKPAGKKKKKKKVGTRWLNSVWKLVDLDLRTIRLTRSITEMKDFVILQLWILSRSPLSMKWMQLML